MAMFKDAIDAYVRGDVDLARSVVPRDDGLDELNRATGRRLIERMAEDPEQLRGYLNLIFVSRCLERVGDHATNMAEDATNSDCSGSVEIEEQRVTLNLAENAAYIRKATRAMLESWGR